MIISPSRRYIFVHIPKTGGTALTMALENRAMADDILIGDTPKALKRRNRLRNLKAKGRLWKHSTLADIDGILTTAELRDYFIFTLVRNPWDLAVSYYHWLQTQNFEHFAVTFAKEVDFSTFVLDRRILRSFRGSNARNYMIDANRAEVPAHYFRLEDLPECLAPLEQHIGKAVGEVPRHNASDRDRNYRIYYDDRTRQAVGQAYADDIARFSYTF